MFTCNWRREMVIPKMVRSLLLRQEQRKLCSQFSTLSFASLVNYVKVISQSLCVHSVRYNLAMERLLRILSNTLSLTHTQTHTNTRSRSLVFTTCLPYNSCISGYIVTATVSMAAVANNSI